MLRRRGSYRDTEARLIARCRNQCMYQIKSIRSHAEITCKPITEQEKELFNQIVHTCKQLEAIWHDNTIKFTDEVRTQNK